MKKTYTFHPFLFAVFPVLFLFSRNLDEVSAVEMLFPGALLVAVTALLLGFLYLVCRTWGRAGVLVSLSWLLFFSYGAFHTLIHDWVFLGHEVGRHRVLLAGWVLVFLAGVFVAFRRSSWLERVNGFLFRCATVLIAIVLANIAWHSVGTRSVPDDNLPEVGTTRSSPVACPDIYYIILDGYARADVLRKLYGYDNGAFLNRLKEMGFYVAEESRSNYPMTGLSLASSLNLTYLDDFVARLDDRMRESCDLRPLISLICNSQALQFLKKFDYSFTTFSPGVAVVDVKTADTYIRPQFRVSAFQNALINMTPLPIFFARLHLKSQYDLHRERILFMLENLSAVATRADRSRPVFVYCHVLSPHPPFVFREDGAPIAQEGKMAFLDDDNIWRRQEAGEEYRQRYLGQLKFISNRILSALEEILAHSPEPPVIILQSDHGPGLKLNWSDPTEKTYWERMSILNAYHLPGLEDDRLYPTISPVNTFRVVFNHYFGARFELLKDECYFMLRNRPYQLEKVTDKIPAWSGGDGEEPEGEREP